MNLRLGRASGQPEAPSLVRAKPICPPYTQIPDHFFKSLPHGALRLLAVIVKALWEKNAWTDRELAAKVERSPGQVQRDLKVLEEQGAIVRHRVHGGRTIELAYTLPAARNAPIARRARTQPHPTGEECGIGADEGRAMSAGSPPIRGFEKEENVTFARAGGEESPAIATAPPTPVAPPVESSSDDDEPDPTPEEVTEWERDAGHDGIVGTIARSKLNIWRNRLKERANPKPTPQPAPPTPQPPASAPTPPADTEGFIRRLETDHSEEWARATAKRMAGRLNDEQSEGFYFRLCRDVQAGAFPLKAALKAYRSVSRSGTAESKGACFVGLVQPIRKGVSRG